MAGGSRMKEGVRMPCMVTGRNTFDFVSLPMIFSLFGCVLLFAVHAIEAGGCYLCFCCYLK